MKFFSRLLLTLLAMSAVSCCIVDKQRLKGDDEDDLPWNEPSGWEDKVPGTQ